MGSDGLLDAAVLRPQGARAASPPVARMEGDAQGSPAHRAVYARPGLGAIESAGDLPGHPRFLGVRERILCQPYEPGAPLMVKRARVITVAWGESYLRELLEISLPGVLAPGNL